MNSNGLASPFMEVDFEGLVATLGGLVGSPGCKYDPFLCDGRQYSGCAMAAVQGSKNAVADQRQRTSIIAVKRLAGHEACSISIVFIRSLQIPLPTTQIYTEKIY
ncbi:hypothetical protein EV1_021526 [Malus domestica]